MLPTLSCLSVSVAPDRCLRHRCSSGSLRISPLHPEFHDPLAHSRRAVSTAVPRLSPGLSRLTDPSAYARLRPVIPINARTLRITAAAGTELAGAYSAGTVASRWCWHPVVPPRLKGFTTRRPSSPTRHCWIRLAPIVQDSPLLPPVGVWAVSQSQCGGSSSQTRYRSSPRWAVTPPTS